MSWIEAIATVFGLACVLLTIRQSILCWPAGLIQVTLYIAVFYKARLYSDLILHVIYVAMQMYGWYHWLHGAADHKSKLKVTILSRHVFGIWMFAGIVGTFGWGFVMKRYTDAAVPYYDAFILAMSLIAQWLMALKKQQSWYFWIAVDIVAFGVYFYKQLYLTTGLYLVFLFLAITGMLAWRKSMMSKDKEPP